MRLLTVFSYLDPGTGSVLIQSLIGVVAGISLFGRKLIASAAIKIKSLFSRSGPGSGNSSGQ